MHGHMFVCVCSFVCVCTCNFAWILSCRGTRVCIQCGADAAACGHVIGYIICNCTRLVNVMCVLYGYMDMCMYVDVCACTLTVAIP